MIKIVVLLFLVLATCYGFNLDKITQQSDGCNFFPNDTRDSAHSFDIGGKGAQITLVSAEFMDLSGKKIYPIQLAKPFVVKIVALNTGPKITSPLLYINLLDYRNNWLMNTCMWTLEQQFSVQNLDACAGFVNCPINQGQQFTLEYKFNFSKKLDALSIDIGSANSIEFFLHNDARQNAMMIENQVKFVYNP
uniref:ML domain-containing protein n=1 Tax=Rhabditophanes sp. KR3021 TaxID=114890 RepID=A0AC35TN94_9BILA